MNEETIRQLIQIVEESNIDSLEVRRWFQTIRIVKNRVSQNGHHVSATEPTTLVHLPIPSPAPAQAGAQPPAQSPPTNLIEIKSPMVGTFYRSASPETTAFADVGKIVKVGDTLCIIEAMKLMNEIESEQSGKIVKILVDNAHPVEFGQPLFLLDPSAS